MGRGVSGIFFPQTQSQINAQQWVDENTWDCLHTNVITKRQFQEPGWLSPLLLNRPMWTMWFHRGAVSDLLCVWCSGESKSPPRHKSSTFHAPRSPPLSPLITVIAAASCRLQCHFHETTRARCHKPARARHTQERGSENHSYSTGLVVSVRLHFADVSWKINVSRCRRIYQPLDFLISTLSTCWI